jgi:hypothetical protein
VNLSEERRRKKKRKKLEYTKEVAWWGGD